jgi:predicted DNA-binding protein with PD1-like motif
MNGKLLDATGQKTFALILDKGEEVVSALTEFARTRQVGAAHFTAIGAFSELTLGYFDRGRKDYKRMPLKEQVEVLSLIGDIALDGDAPKVHAHVVVGRSDGTAHGGHLLEGRVWPTLEVILVESPRFLRKRHDPDTGLALIDPAA